MVRHLGCSRWFAAIAAPLTLQGSGKSSPLSLDRESPRSVATRAAEADAVASRADAFRGPEVLFALPL